MRIKLLSALLGFCLLTVLVGCSGNGTSGLSIFGGVFSTGGTRAPNSTVTLFRSGTQVRSPFTSNTGAFSFRNLSPGTYTLLATGGANTVPTLVGPFDVRTTRIINITTPTLQELQTQTGVTTPTNNTTTVVVEAFDSVGNALPQFSVTIGNQTVQSTPNSPAFAIVQNVMGSPQSILVTNPATGQTVELPGVTFTPGTILFVRAIFSPTRFGVSGNVSNSVTGTAGSNQNVAIPSSGSAAVRTNSQGQFEFTNVRPGTYIIKTSSRTSGSSATFTGFAGPFTGSGAMVDLPTIFTFTRNDLGTVVPGGVTIPTNGTATLVIYAVTRNAAGVTSILPNATALVEGRNFTAVGAVPVVATGLTKSSGTAIQVTANGKTVVLTDVPIAVNTITVINAFIPQ